MTPVSFALPADPAIGGRPSAGLSAATFSAMLHGAVTAGLAPAQTVPGPADAATPVVSAPATEPTAPGEPAAILSITLQQQASLRGPSAIALVTSTDKAKGTAPDRAADAQAGTAPAAMIEVMQPASDPATPARTTATASPGMIGSLKTDPARRPEQSGCEDTVPPNSAWTDEAVRPPAAGAPEQQDETQRASAGKTAPAASAKTAPFVAKPLSGEPVASTPRFAAPEAKVGADPGDRESPAPKQAAGATVTLQASDAGGKRTEAKRDVPHDAADVAAGDGSPVAPVLSPATVAALAVPQPPPCSQQLQPAPQSPAPAVRGATAKALGPGAPQASAAHAAATTDDSTAAHTETEEADAPSAFAATVAAMPDQRHAPARLVADHRIDTGAAALPSAPTADPLKGVVHQLDLARDGAWLDSLARDIARSADPNGRLHFSLAPERLGRLDVQLAANADGTAIRLVTETRDAHRIVADAQPQLIAEARAQGLRVSETRVDLAGNGSGGAAPQSFGNQNSGGGGQPHQPRWRPEPSAPAPAPAPGHEAGADELYA